MRLTPRSPPRVTVAEADRVRVLTRAAFSWRRKQLGTILSRHPDLRIPRAAVHELLGKRGLSPRMRPEQLSPEEFVELGMALSA